jgi:membrane dipeptidase
VSSTRWIRCAIAAAFSLAFVACGGEVVDDTGREPTMEDDPALRRRAEELAQSFMIVDTHVDLPYRLTERPGDPSERMDGGDFDYPRARAGGLDVPFMSIFVPASHQQDGGAKALADELIDMVEKLADEHPDKFAIVTDVASARRSSEAGLVGLAMGIENGAAIEDDLDNLQHFYDRGARYVTLTHSKKNLICDSSYDKEDRLGGLSEFGTRAVTEMNRLGIMIDVSHVSDDTFFQVVELSRAPVIASHSSCRAFTPKWERNMSDEMIRRLAETGGVIQINFGSSFINETYRAAREEHWKEVDAYLEEKEIDPQSNEGRDYRRQYFADRPVDYADISEVVDHIDHVVELVGVDHVGFGSDFDGVGDSLPVGLKDVSDFPNLIYELLKRGYSEEEIEKICSGNLLRVWSEVERIAAEQG